MIANRSRVGKRGRPVRKLKKLDNLYAESKCRECTVVVTRMDFAKILGKFTKVKIQYESSSAPKAKQTAVSSPNSNARLKSNENGMVLIHRNAYNQHPVKELKKPKVPVYQPNLPSPIKTLPKKLSPVSVLKENNRHMKTPYLKKDISNLNNKRPLNKNSKQYGIVFVNPVSNTKSNDHKNKITLTELVPIIDKNILPSVDWCIEYFPKKDEYIEDKVYDRIAAELEDLMYNEKTVSDCNKNESADNLDEFPSIMDILNDGSNESKLQDSISVDKANLESSDVEAMLLGKSNDVDTKPMEVDSVSAKNLIEDVEQLNVIQDSVKVLKPKPDASGTDTMITDENPNSPSILDEALQKGIEEHLPNSEPQKLNVVEEQDSINLGKNPTTKMENENSEVEEKTVKVETNLPTTRTDITHITFNKIENGKTCRSVLCPKDLKYSIEIDGKSVEFIGAPTYISNLEDLKVLLQIVNESDLESLYVMY